MVRVATHPNGGSIEATTTRDVARDSVARGSLKEGRWSVRAASPPCGDLELDFPSPLECSAARAARVYAKPSRTWPTCSWSNTARSSAREPGGGSSSTQMIASRS